MNKINYENLNYDIKIKIYHDQKDFGPGVAKIMELIRETGTLSEAYRAMEMSSSKAWKIIKKAEKDLGIKLIDTVTGGAGGGKSTLTKEGEDFLDRYISFSNELENIAKELFNKHFSCDIINKR
ncbi:LysR family transcriptional regulator [Tissierella sp. Yu-01]|uniref:winged helix-turn-helix domain-containing protein n=1 Tax=Tissierella sp. Yu-01 TaxID=3035694 RepID=UPI00240D0EC0|nr:LysR family transcriptional regulator [Tissierella sp. Yu-01]WFA09021.1 LysR family transcriptional regulator [Tissierella sp. Yu-01]